MIFKQKRLFWQIFPATLAIILTSILVVGWYSAHLADSFYIKESSADLINRAHLISSTVIELLEEQETGALNRFAVQSGRASETRITVIAENGTVLADTQEDPARMDNHRQRPEIDEAFNGSPGTSLRFSSTLGERMLYAAIPINHRSWLSGAQDDDLSTAVLRLSMPITAIDLALSTLNKRLTFGTIFAILVAFLVTLFVSRNISRPLEEMTARAKHYSEGDFSQRMMMRKVTASQEVATLAAAMDRMADQLDEKINTILNQRNQLETVFSSMVEAVIAIDRDERIISMNTAAGQLFKVDREEAQGCLVQEVIRNAAIHRQIEQVLSNDEPLEDEITLTTATGERYLQTHAVALYDANGSGVGVLVVLNDVTRLRRLENVRKDFVANVSHELRTPITSIRGYVETLLEGAIDDKDNAKKFLEIVMRQSQQLSEIIDDLLALSRIEEINTREMSFEYQPLLPVLEDAVQTCFHKAREKEVSLVVDCPDDIQLRINRTLFEQAIVNLLINGITYSEQGGCVTITGNNLTHGEQQCVEIRVIDNGIGIAKEHLPRLFERFYRSDKARTRKLGGTGLGLSIVKHIVQAHQGSVDVKSKQGEGSEFILTI